jgi:1,2-diacylglycerol 3-alpha-glucosyltransferase
LIPSKGVFDLFDAYTLLPAELRAEWGLVFVGSGAAMHELQQRAAHEQSGSIKIAGFAQREQLAAYYGLAEALVFPTHTDPWGLVVNEAMACGLPIIASDAAGCTADLVRDGWNGYVVPAGDVRQFAAAMEKIAACKELRSKMAEHSLELIAQYSPEACATGIANAVLSRGRAH